MPGGARWRKAGNAHSTGMEVSEEEAAAIGRVVRRSGAEGEDYARHPFNVLRWISAYEGDEEEAAKVLGRHLHLRRLMNLERLAETEDGEEGSCPLTPIHAPINILGCNLQRDNKVLLHEMTGRLDIQGLVQNIRISRFMRSRFRLMERVHQEVVRQEKATGHRGGAVLVMDLQQLHFTPSLLTILAGPYRIVWGTLFEQFPQLIQRILIVHAPVFVNILYSTCIPFIPDDYRKKITICSAASPAKTLLPFVDPEILPKEYGGEAGPVQVPVSPFPKADPISVELESISIPPGKQMCLKYKLSEGEDLLIYMEHSNDFTLFYFYSAVDTKETSRWEEIRAGCERPGLPGCTDVDEWKVPKDGFYFIRFGNEKAWLLPATVRFALHFHDIPLTPLERFSLSF